MSRYSCALVTGASSGLGEGFAEELAATGTDVIIVARSADKLQAIAARLRQQTGRRIEAIALDLTRPDASTVLLSEVRARGLTVDLLINNAGVGLVGKFLDQPIERLQQIVALNGPLVVAITHAFLPDMVGLGRGAVINIGSIGSFQPMPGMAVYGGAKAFVLSFSQALGEEYRDKGIRCLAYCPGPIDSGFFEASGRPELRNDIPPAFLMSPRECAKRAMRALAQGKAVHVPSMPVALFCQVHRILPKRMMTRVAGLITGR